jgi:hypothetical protein
MLGLTKFIHGIEGLAWCNFSLTFFACVATVVNGYFFIEHCENSKDASDNKQSLAV